MRRTFNAAPPPVLVARVAAGPHPAPGRVGARAIATASGRCRLHPRLTEVCGAFDPPPAPVLVAWGASATAEAVRHGPTVHTGADAGAHWGTFPPASPPVLVTHAATAPHPVTRRVRRPTVTAVLLAFGVTPRHRSHRSVLVRILIFDAEAGYPQHYERSTTNGSTSGRLSARRAAAAPQRGTMVPLP